jgi:hypothetical protein
MTLCIPLAITSASAMLGAASSRLSVSSWPASRARPAPIASRIANSRRRPSARSRSRFDTFAHASNNTSPAAAANTANDCVTEVRYAGQNFEWLASKTMAVRLPFVAGSSRATAPAIACNSACARPTVTPGRIRPINTSHGRCR